MVVFAVCIEIDATGPIWAGPAEIGPAEIECDVLTVYVPMPPVPVPSAVIVVFAAMPVPVRSIPTTRVPDDTPVTLSVVPLMLPVKEAFAGVSYLYIYIV